MTREGSARLVALRALLRVEREAAFANLALDGEVAQAGLDPRDAALATELTYGVLRRRGALDRSLAPWVRSGWDRLEDEVKQLLRLGAYQLLHTRIPPHAAVGETVSLSRRIGLARASGLVNAVLRRLAQEGPPPPLDPAADPLAWLQVEGSLPSWLARSLLARLGAEEAVRFVHSINQPARASIRANLLRTTVNELERRLAGDVPDARIDRSGRVPEALLVEGGGSLPRLAAFAEGLFSLQDEAAQLVAHLAGDVEGLRILDACAAPGGKSCHFGERGAGEVVSLDRSERKVRRIADEARRLGLDSIHPIAGDATEPLPPGDWDVVLVDAPCTALGTLRRHPELRYRREEDDVQRLASTQAAILDRAAAAVRRGGILVYAVCTFTEEEGPAQVESFLRRHEGKFEAAPLDPAPPWSRGGWLLETWPHREDMDAFFAARMRKI